MIEDFKNFSAFTSDDDPITVLLVGETYCDKNFSIVRPNSDLNAFEFIVDGIGTLDIDGQHLFPQKDDIFFLREGTNHSYRSDRDNPWHKFWIVFGGKLAQPLIDAYIPENTYLFKNCNIKHHFEKIFLISKEDIPYEKMVNKITVELMQIFMYIKTRTQLGNEDLAEAIRKRLDEAVESSFNLDRLCSEINYSKNYIINIFKEKYSVTPYQYYLERKIDTAKIYLIHTNMSIGAIAKTLHYADQQYFSSSFKTAVGCSPLEFRRKTRR
ncbi:MAG: AraC family transcriptional regulator [Eubacterium sp.]